MPPDETPVPAATETQPPAAEPEVPPPAEDPDLPPLAPGHDKVEDGLASLDIFGDEFVSQFPEYAELAKTEFRIPKEQLAAAMADATTRNIVLGIRHAYDRKSRSTVEQLKAANAHVLAANQRADQFKSQIGRLRSVIDKGVSAAKVADTGGKAPDPHTEAGQKTIAQQEAARFLGDFATGIKGGLDEIAQESEKAVAAQARTERLAAIEKFAKAHDDFDALRPEITEFRKSHPGTPVEAAYHHVRAIRQTQGKKIAPAAKGSTRAAPEPQDDGELIPKSIQGNLQKTIEYLNEHPDVRKKLLARVDARA